MCIYLNKDQLLVQIQVEGCIDVRGNLRHVFRVAVVKHEPRVPPHFTACDHRQVQTFIIWGKMYKYANFKDVNVSF